MGCHSVTPGGTNGIGPNLHRVVGRDIAHAAECASRTQLTFDLIVKAYPLGTCLRREIQQGFERRNLEVFR